MRMPQHPRALTLIEAIILLVIISIVAIAAGVGLQAVAKVPANTDAYMAANNVAVSVLEQTRANLLRNWPAATWGGANFAFLANGTSYTPTAGTALGTAYSTPISGASPAPLLINNETYLVALTLATADPGVGSAKPDFIQVTVTVCPVIAGTVQSNAPQKLVTYVAQP